MDQISNPAPKIEWHKKDEQQSIPIWIPPDDPNDMNPANRPPRRYALRGRHLIIRSVTEADSGTYEMVVTNEAGRASISFDLLVNFPPEFHPTLTHEKHSLDEDSSITLDCGIKKRAIPGSIVYWEKDQRVLEKYTNSLMVPENNGEVLRFPAVKPEDQGLYQCFVQTDGYKKRWAGREQSLIVKAKLQFLRAIREHFLEVNVQGRIPCKARGHGTVKVEWFRKTGPNPENIERIHAPNQVEGGTLIIQYVTKHDAGEYICVATSSYKNARINMTVKVIVGEKPQITQISTNQTVRVDKQVILNCHASGDPHPQISWIVKRAGYKVSSVFTPIAEPGQETRTLESSNDSSTSTGSGAAPNGGAPSSSSASASSLAKSVPSMEGIDSGLASVQNSDPVMSAITRNIPDAGGRIVAYTNGSLVIQQAHLADQAEYICVAGNKHAIKTRQGVFLRVLTHEEYTRQQLGGSGTSSGMMKTIMIVVGCAVTYLGMIIGLTVFCSMRMLRTRRNRSRKAAKLHENGQLLTPLGDPAGHPGPTRGSQGSGGAGNPMECGLLMTAAGANAASGQSGNLTMGHMPHYGHPLLSSTSGTRSGTSFPETSNEDRTNSVAHPLISGSGLGPNSNQLPPIPQNDAKCWWPVSDNSYYGHNDAQAKLLPHGVDGFSNPLTDGTDLNNQAYLHGHSLVGSPCTLMFSGMKGPSTGVGSSTLATTTSESHLMSAPPPTPLDSRSHFSGVSSGNSTSLYSRSLLSGASNFGSPTPQGQHLNGLIPYDQANGMRSISQADRMNYPRCELQMEGILGKGEFGDVFLARARHIQDGEVQSLVLVKSLASHDPIHVNEFHRQLELFGQSDHDYVTRLLGVCMEQDPFYMLLEYCEWGDLKQFLRCMREENSVPFKMPPLTRIQKLNLCKQLAMGMDYLAHMRSVHRDLAARNILLTQEMEVKISNLGLARDVYANEYYRLPNTEQFIPLRWFAPELIADATQFSASGHHLVNGDSEMHSHNNNNVIMYTTNSDVWAFGVLVCEVFSLAALPLARLSDQEIIVAGQRTALQAQSGANGCGGTGTGTVSKTTNPHVPLKPDIPAEIPSELANMLTRCWSPCPQRRPSFSEIASLLRDLASMTLT